MNKSRVFTAAHKEMKESDYQANWSQCLKNAYAQERTRMSLRASIIETFKTGVSEFTFTKVDGTTRIAFGTLDSSIFSYTTKTTKKRKKNVEVVKYYDTEKKFFRSFKLDNFTGFKVA